MDDETDIRRALELAERGWGRTSPNPMVGAVVTRDGRVIAEGWHEGPGKAHAEAMALAAAGDAARGATLSCTLEPCDHFGRTPPCTSAIIDAGITRVVVAMRDPNPVVDGRGIERLRTAGIDVMVLEGPVSWQAARLNASYARHVVSGLPLVTLKVAATLDGKIAAADGSSTWITGEEARADVQHLRAGSDAILVGVGTALADDPRLTVRDPSSAGEAPLRIVVDSAGRLAPDGRLFDGSAPTLVATTARATSECRDAWREAGADVLECEPDRDGRVSLSALTQALGKRDVQSLLIEGGAEIAGSAIRDEVIDRVVVYLAPRLLGGDAAPGMLGETGIGTLADAKHLTIVDVRRMGADIRVEADVHRDR